MKKLIFYGSFTILAGSLYAQGDSLAGKMVIDAETTSLEQGSNILNGKSHITYSSSISGSAYSIKEWSTGSLRYEDVLYINVRLKYDEFKDELILLHPNGLAIILFTPRVQSFELAGRKFINLKSGIASASVSETGYYEQLLNGRIMLLAKRKKTLDEKLQTTGVTKTFLNASEYFVVKDGRLHKIKKESALLELMPEKRQGAKNLLKEANVNFNNDPESALIMIAEYYNQSSN